ncbi:MAG: RNA 2',3'-cyclic phosphodiesterase, partial [Planctomycetota bacterium]
TRHNSFELAVETVGSFGGRSARGLWTGTTAGSDRLAELQSDLEDELAVAGWPKESRKFSAHLTLCRIKNSKAGVKLVQVSHEYKDFKLGSIMVDSVSVYQSQLTSDGPIYTILGNYKLS